MTGEWFYSKFRKSKRNKRTNRVITGSEIVRSSIHRPNRPNRLTREWITRKFNSVVAIIVSENVFSLISLHQETLGNKMWFMHSMVFLLIYWITFLLFITLRWGNAIRRLCNNVVFLPLPYTLFHQRRVDILGNLCFNWSKLFRSISHI